MRNTLILLIFLTPNIILGQENYIEKTIKNHFIKLDKIECKYTQKKEISMINEPLVSTGILNYEKGSDFIWTQETPFKKIYLINEKAKNKFDEYINKFIISIITGEILDDKKLEVIYSQNNDKYKIIMTPKKGAIKNKLKTINLTFRKKTISLSRLEIVFKNSDVTNIYFYEN